MTPAPDTPDLATPERLVEMLRGLGEAQFYEEPATTHLLVNGAATLIETQAARIRKLEAEVAGLKSLMWPESITAQVGYTSCAVCGTAHHAADECPRCDLESVASRLA